jgi:hypothetical protein
MLRTAPPIPYNMPTTVFMARTALSDIGTSVHMSKMASAIFGAGFVFRVL